jgi:asparagine synthase (glutamine-hydrolysing)
MTYLPDDILTKVDRAAMGIPLDVWLRGPLKSWAEALLDESRLIHEGFFNPAPIRAKWSEHQAGRRNWSYYLWDVLMFQAWQESRR